MGYYRVRDWLWEVREYSRFRAVRRLASFGLRVLRGGNGVTV